MQKTPAGRKQIHNYPKDHWWDGVSPCLSCSLLMFSMKSLICSTWSNLSSQMSGQTAGSWLRPDWGDQDLTVPNNFLRNVHRDLGWTRLANPKTSTVWHVFFLLLNLFFLKIPIYFVASIRATTSMGLTMYWFIRRMLLFLRSVGLMDCSAS